MSQNRCFIPLSPDLDPGHPLFDTEYCERVFEIYPAYYQQTGYEPPFIAYLIQEDQTIVGICSFTQPPIDGRVEISYWTFQQYERRGVASAACAYLIAIARTAGPSLEIFAKTLPEHNASTKILERNGFKQTRVVHDEDVGDAWEWTYPTNV